MRLLFVSVTAAALLAGCQQKSDTSNNAAVAAGTTAAAVAADSKHMASMDAMMRDMQAAPMAHDAAMARMHERHEGMERIGKAFKTAGRALKAGTPDIAAVRASAATIAGLAPKTTTWFPNGTGPAIGKTGAKPEIWKKPADFIARDRDMQLAAAAFDAAAKGGDLKTVQARFGALGKTCKACHDSYRSEMHH